MADNTDSILDRAALERAADVDALDFLDAAQLDYLARLGSLEDPATDDVEGRCE